MNVKNNIILIALGLLLTGCGHNINYTVKYYPYKEYKGPNISAIFIKEEDKKDIAKNYFKVGRLKLSELVKVCRSSEKKDENENSCRVTNIGKKMDSNREKSEEELNSLALSTINKMSEGSFVTNTKLREERIVTYTQNYGCKVYGDISRHSEKQHVDIVSSKVNVVDVTTETRNCKEYYITTINEYYLDSEYDILGRNE